MAAKRQVEDESVVTGLENAKTAKEKKEKEYDLVEALLAAADFRHDENLITTAEIKRNGQKYFEVDIHPIGDEEARAIRRRATSYMPNPVNPKLPPVEKKFDQGKFNALIIYEATTEEHKRLIWGNKEIMTKYNLVEPYESVDVLLTVGEKNNLSDMVLKISGWEDDIEKQEEDYVKN